MALGAPPAPEHLALTWRWPVPRVLCRYGTTTDPPVSDNICNNIWLPGVGTFILNLAVTSEREGSQPGGCQLACNLCRLLLDSDR